MESFAVEWAKAPGNVKKEIKGNDCWWELKSIELDDIDVEQGVLIEFKQQTGMLAGSGYRVVDIYCGRIHENVSKRKGAFNSQAYLLTWTQIPPEKQEGVLYFLYSKLTRFPFPGVPTIEVKLPFEPCVTL